MIEVSHRKASLMAQLTGQAAAQLANIEESTGKSLAEFTKEIATTGLTKHGEIVAYLKKVHGIGHGNANLVAKLARDEMAGGAASQDELLAAQYEGAKAALRPIYEEVATVANAQGDDVEQVIQKTGVSFRRRKQFLLVQAPSSKRIQLGLNLPVTPPDDRVRETTGMCSHRVDVTSIDEVDDDLATWIRAAYQAAG